MLPWTLREAAALVNGRLTGGGDVIATGVSHDSRNVKRGDLFVAIKGYRLDGHRFVGKAAKKGAKGVVVSRLLPVALPQIKVRDTTLALGQMGRAQRLQWEGPVVAVTGSVGKTTVKDMTAHLLSGTYRVLKAQGNLNNQWGLPLTLLGLTRKHEAAVVELGINHPGEMERLSEIARPDVTIVTAVGEAHLGFFKSRRHLAEEKKKIAAGLREGGIKILNADDIMLKTSDKDVMTFGLNLGSVRATHLEPQGLGTRFVLEADGEKAATNLQMPGVFNVSNSAAAVAAGLALGIPLKALAKRLRSFIPQAWMRMEIKNLRGILFINDAYNASPTSMQAALETFRAIKGPNRKIAVLGDMLEMGEFSEESHLRIARMAAEGPFASVILVGGRMVQAARELPGRMSETVKSFRRVSEAGRFLKSRAQKGDAILLKASRGIRLEKILEEF